MYAVVRLDVSPVAAYGLSIELDAAPKNDPGALQYEPAVRVGIRYAWDRARHAKRPHGANVRVLDITTMVVDTTEITVVYAAALATWDALGFRPDPPMQMVRETRSLVFPIF